MTFPPRLSLRTLAAVGATGLAAASLVACDSPDNNADAPPATTTMTATTQPAETSSPSETRPETPTETVTETGAPDDDTVLSSLAGASTGDTQQEPSGEWALEVTDVRAGDHEGFDRVVFEFSGTGTPGWFAGFVDEPRQQASGYPVEMAGDSFLEINIPGMAMPLDPSDDTAVPEAGVIDGAGGHGRIADIYFGSVFEAQGQFVIGLNGDERPYQIQLLQEPTRLVVDIES